MSKNKRRLLYVVVIWLIALALAVAGWAAFTISWVGPAIGIFAIITILTAMGISFADFVTDDD